jgi:hypothetical protein
MKNVLNNAQNTDLPGKQEERNLGTRERTRILQDSEWPYLSMWPLNVSTTLCARRLERWVPVSLLFSSLVLPRGPSQIMPPANLLTSNASSQFIDQAQARDSLSRGPLWHYYFTPRQDPRHYLMCTVRRYIPTYDIANLCVMLFYTVRRIKSSRIVSYLPNLWYVQ